MGVSALLPFSPELSVADDNRSCPPADAIFPESTLQDAIEHIVYRSHHRVYVKDHDSRPQAIITITDILRLFI